MLPLYDEYKKKTSNTKGIKKMKKLLVSLTIIASITLATDYSADFPATDVHIEMAEEDILPLDRESDVM